MATPPNLSSLWRANLEALLVELLGQVAELKALVAAQRDEIARLKGLKGRPSIKPSGMEGNTKPPRGGKTGELRRSWAWSHRCCGAGAAWQTGQDRRHLLPGLGVLRPRCRPSRWRSATCAGSWTGRRWSATF